MLHHPTDRQTDSTVACCIVHLPYSTPALLRANLSLRISGSCGRGGTLKLPLSWARSASAPRDPPSVRPSLAGSYSAAFPIHDGDRKEQPPLPHTRIPILVMGWTLPSLRLECHGNSSTYIPELGIEARFQYTASAHRITKDEPDYRNTWLPAYRYLPVVQHSLIRLRPCEQRLPSGPQVESSIGCYPPVHLVLVRIPR